jgi:putative phage-type endonuclease
MTEPAQRSPEWHKQRAGRVTGSIAGAILSLDPNKSRDDVMRRMVRDALGAPREDENQFLEDVIFGYGKMHEPGAVLDFQMDTGLNVIECGFFAYDDWLGASPDGLTSDGGVLEIKAPWSRRTGQDRCFKPLSDQPQYFAQVQIEMLCAGRQKAHFYQYSSHAQLHEVVPLDQAWIDENIPRLRQFHAEFLDIIASPDLAAEHLAPLRVVIDTPEAAKCVRGWDEIAEQMELLQERKADLLAQMVDMAGSRDATIAGRKLTLVEKAGSVSYKKALDHYAPKADTSKFMGKSSSYWKMT